MKTQPSFLTDPIEKLVWIASREPNPTRSQIHNFVPHFIDGDITECMYYEKYMLKWYDEVAQDLLYYLKYKENRSSFDERWMTLDNPKMIEMIDGMYHDIINNNKWGFKFDW